MRLRLLFLLPCLVMAFASGCKDRLETYDYDKQAILADIVHGQVLPNLAQFRVAADSLSAVTGRFATQPDSVNLVTLRAQWVATNLRWKACEAFEFGPVKDRHLHSRIGKWPTDPVMILSKVGAGLPMDEAFFEGLGATSRGLPAMEFLLWESAIPATIAAFTSDTLAAERTTYLVGLAHDLQRKAKALQDIWYLPGENYAQEFPQSTGTGIDDPMGLMVNAMIGLLEEVTKTKLGKPFGKFDLGILQPDMVESSRANVSLELLRANMEALQSIYVGGTGTGLDQALDDLHAQYGGAPLSETVTAQFEEVFQALDQIMLPLQDAMVTQHDAVENTWQALKALIVLFKADVCSAMSLTVTVSDADGD